MTRPSAGLTANWMLQPPVSTPTARMIAMPMSRSCWYSRSVSVIAGATVIESPVCTPIGSRFSIEQTITTLSAVSRMSSSSYSFQPRIDSSRSTSVVGLAAQPGAGDAAQVVLVVGEAGADAAHGEATAAPPSGSRARRRRREALVDGVADAELRATRRRASSTIVLERLAVLAALDRLDARRRSARRRTSRGRRPRAARSPCSARSGRRGSASSASGRSLAMIFSTNSGVIGST